MGLFSHKQPVADDAHESEQHFFDEYYREELRNHGRWYFEKIISENGELFKEDLNQTVENITAELKDHITTKLDTAIAEANTAIKESVTSQLESQLLGYGETIKQTQEEALKTLTQSAQAAQEQQVQLSAALQKTASEQAAIMTRTFEENNVRLSTMHDAQDSALQVLQQSLRTLQEQHEKMNELLGQSFAQQEANVVRAFEENMAQIIEHYVVGALGDQFDLKAQLPSIIKQMEQNKQAIVDDMTL